MTEPNTWSNSQLVTLAISRNATPEDIDYIEQFVALAIKTARRIAQHRQWAVLGFDPISMGM